MNMNLFVIRRPDRNETILKHCFDSNAKDGYSRKRLAFSSQLSGQSLAGQADFISVRRSLFTRRNSLSTSVHCAALTCGSCQAETLPLSSGRMLLSLLMLESLKPIDDYSRNLLYWGGAIYTMRLSHKALDVGALIV